MNNERRQADDFCRRARTAIWRRDLATAAFLFTAAAERCDIPRRVWLQLVVAAICVAAGCWGGVRRRTAHALHLLAHAVEYGTLKMDVLRARMEEAARPQYSVPDQR